MTEEEACEIRLHLLDSLERYGFSDINKDITIKLTEIISSEKKLKLGERFLLNFSLRESISTLESLSNDRFEELLIKFNKYVKADGKKIDSISVVLVDKENNITEKSNEYNLIELPSYVEIIKEFRKIQKIIESNN